MKRQEIPIAVAGQSADAYFFTGDDERPRPGMLLLTDIKGIRLAYEEQAERLVKAGFAVLLPNVFFRGGRPPLFPFPFQSGEIKTVHRLQELFAALPPEAQLADAEIYLDCLTKMSGVRSGSLGVVGYCYTGAMAIRAAAACPSKVQAAASFHGGNLFTDLPESPHLLLPKIKAALHIGHAVDDKSMPAEAIASLDKALGAWGGKFTSKVYAGAQHGWTNRDSPIFNLPQAEQAFADLISFLRETLK